MSDIDKAIFKIMDIAKSNEICYIADLWDYLERESLNDLFVEFRKREVYGFFKVYLSELRGSMRRSKKKVPPPVNSWHNSKRVVKQSNL